MIVDSSAVLAILFDESDSRRFASAIMEETPCRMSSATALETAIVLESRGGLSAGSELDRLLLRAGMELMPVTPEQFEIARAAWRRYGKGNHPAALNFGDCFAYALAKSAGEPLLFKGGDFSRTDIEAA